MKYELANVLGGLHAASGMSQDEAVRMIQRRSGEQMHQTAFSSYLTNSDRHRVPSLLSAAALAMAYNVSIEYLMGWVKDRRPVATLLERLSELTFSPAVEGAAKRLASLPEAYQRKHIAAIEADCQAWERERRWELLSKFIPESEQRRILAIASAGADDGDPVMADTAVRETLFELA